MIAWPLVPHPGCGLLALSVNVHGLLSGNLPEGGRHCLLPEPLPHYWQCGGFWAVLPIPELPLVSLFCLRAPRDGLGDTGWRYCLPLAPTACPSAASSLAHTGQPFLASVSQSWLGRRWEALLFAFGAYSLPICCLLCSHWSAHFSLGELWMAWEPLGGDTVCIWHLPPPHLLPPVLPLVGLFSLSET